MTCTFARWHTATSGLAGSQVVRGSNPRGSTIGGRTPHQSWRFSSRGADAHKGWFARVTRGSVRPMTRCATCGQNNPDGFRFCGGCGVSIEAEAPSGVVRKTVTLVFSDIAGSTAMGEGRDPEATRGAMDRYFAQMRQIIERHGGIVEKFVGDAVMAAFGIPVIHEDDATRAVRAAAEMRDRMITLNDELERDWGTRLNARIGVNTGEVVVGDPSARQTFATGDTVNTAARLEQAAPPNEILISAATLHLVRDAVRVEPVEPLTLKGKAEPVPAFRLVEVDPLAFGQARRTDLALVGRQDELSLLQRMFDEVVDTSDCRLGTVIGTAGVGKSRLLEEFSGRVSDRARVFHGRCLPYGEGITFFPIAEVVRAAASIAEDDAPDRAIEKLGSFVALSGQHASIVEGVAVALDLKSSSLPIDQLNWSIRRWLEQLAASGPVVVVLDDLQWAEAALLDLVDHVARLAMAPLLLIGMARPEFQDRLPDWAAGTPNAFVLRLEPLATDAGEELITSILGAPLDPSLGGRILDTAGGNPLFVQELVGQLIDDGQLARVGERWQARRDLTTLTMPASIEALLAERIERLAVDEQSVLGTGAVIGQVFYRGAVMEMAPADVGRVVDEHLADLDRREYIRPIEGTIRSEEAFSFRHLLIRDAAYRRLSKGLRARLHAAFAGWLGRTAGPWFSGRDEILGYHLEQAVGFRSEISPSTDDDLRMAREAAEFLAAAGRRAMARGDARATSNLLARSAALVPADDSWRQRVEVDLGRALNDAGRQEAARELVTDVEARARAMGEPLIAVAASVIRSIVELFSGTGDWSEEAKARASEALAILEPLDPTPDLMAAEELMALISISAGQVSGAADWLGRAVEHADLLGDPATSARLRSQVTGSLLLGRTSASEGIVRCEHLLSRIGDYRAARGNALANLGALRGVTGDIEGARLLIQEGSDMLIDLGVVGSQMGGPALRASRLFIVETFYGDLSIAETELRAACDHLEEIGESWAGTTAYAELALVLCDQMRFGEAAEAAHRSRETSARDDLIGEAGWRASLGRAYAHAGLLEETEVLVTEAVRIVSTTEHLLEQADAFRALAEVLEMAGKSHQAVEAAGLALQSYRKKGVTEAAHPIRRLDSILRSHGETPPTH
jgi:class 3 adenylate cyclase/tetratricopeptide (TPR) repeat protein